MRITTKGQVSIPRKIREKAGLYPGTEDVFELVGDSVIIRKAKGNGNRGQVIVRQMRGKGTGRMTTDQIMALTRG